MHHMDGFERLIRIDLFSQETRWTQSKDSPDVIAVCV